MISGCWSKGSSAWFWQLEALLGSFHASQFLLGASNPTERASWVASQRNYTTFAWQRSSSTWSISDGQLSVSIWPRRLTLPSSSACWTSYWWREGCFAFWVSIAHHSYPPNFASQYLPPRKRLDCVAPSFLVDSLDYSRNSYFDWVLPA